MNEDEKFIQQDLRRMERERPTDKILSKQDRLRLYRAYVERGMYEMDKYLEEMA